MTLNDLLEEYEKMWAIWWDNPHSDIEDLKIWIKNLIADAYNRKREHR